VHLLNLYSKNLPGTNVTEYMSGITPRQSVTGRNFVLIGSIPETNEMIAATSTREIIIWKYNHAGPITTLRGHSQSVECLTYSKKALHFYSGGGESMVNKWELETKEQNPFVYRYFCSNNSLQKY
jgi:WD40 repeat protein